MERIAQEFASSMTTGQALSLAKVEKWPSGIGIGFLKWQALADKYNRQGAPGIHSYPFESYVIAEYSTTDFSMKEFEEKDCGPEPESSRKNGIMGIWNVVSSHVPCVSATNLDPRLKQYLTLANNKVTIQGMGCWGAEEVIQYYRKAWSRGGVSFTT